MRTIHFLLLPALLLPLTLSAQGPGPDSRPAPHPMMEMHHPGPDGDHGPMGQWWKNSDVAQKLKLTDQQIQELDKKFYDHRLKLIDYQADAEKQNFKLQTLLDADNPDEAQVSAQVDQTLAARGKLEREFTMMNLDLRKVLSVEQWRQLKDLHDERGGPGRFHPHGEGMEHPGMVHPDMQHPGMEHPSLGTHTPSGAQAAPPAPEEMPSEPAPAK